MVAPITDFAIPPTAVDMGDNPVDRGPPPSPTVAVSPAASADALDNVAPLKHLRQGTQTLLLTPRAAAKAIQSLRPPGPEALLRLYALLHEEPYVTLADVNFHHWLSMNSLVPGQVNADPEQVVAWMEKTAREVSPNTVRARLINDVVRFPCTPRRLSAADLPKDEVRTWLDENGYRLVAVRADGQSGFFSSFMAALYALFEHDPERLVRGLERAAMHAAPECAQGEELQKGCDELRTMANQVRCGKELDGIVHGMRNNPAIMRSISWVLRSFMNVLEVPEYVQDPEGFMAVEHLEMLGRALFGMETSVVDSERGLGHSSEVDGAHGLHREDTLYVLRSGVFFDALITVSS